MNRTARITKGLAWALSKTRLSSSNSPGKESERETAERLGREQELYGSRHFFESDRAAMAG